jgi:hypothetical protein
MERTVQVQGDTPVQMSLISEWLMGAKGESTQYLKIHFVKKAGDE